MSRGLRFAMLTTFYPPYHFGGDGEAVRRLSHALARRGHQVDVIHDVDAFRLLSNDQRPRPEGTTPGVRVHGLRSRSGPLSNLATHQTGRPVVHGRQIRRILAEGFDVVHFHNVSLVGGPGLFAYGEGVKLYTAHEHWLVCASHVLWRHDRELCTGRECLRCVLRYRRPPQLWRATGMLRRESRHVDAFLTYSRFCADKHAELGFEVPLKVIPSFLPDEEGSEPVRSGDRGADARPYVLFVGRLEQIKGLQTILPTFDGEGDVDLWVAGLGKEEETLRAQVGSASRVRFLGHQTQAELRGLYRDALAVVIPSVCFEVFPMVVLEAFREGTPIIARDLGPFPEIIDQSGGGLLFRDADELERALTSLVVHPERRAELGQAAAQAFHARWAEGVALEQYFEVIRGVARARGMDDVLARARLDV